jgi:glyoxylase-like metal-dependent hydrolase (beta-lactamase superfamily II)
MLIAGAAMEERMTVSDIGTYDPSRAATQLEGGTWLIDLGFQNRGEVVAAYLLVDYGELALIETGPSSTLENLKAAVRHAGFDPARITKLLVTHIHLDHAGAAGPLARENPEIQVYVHPFGVPHMIDPSKLLSSATRIYGDRMEPLWGEVAPIAESQVRTLVDGESLRVAGRDLQVIFTPGHAWHHVAFWDPESGTAFTGDVGGVRMPGTGYNCPPTPPPDLDPAAWAESIRRLQALGARRWCLTHYGPFDDATEHMAQLMPELDALLALGMDALDRGIDHDSFTAMIHDRMAEKIGDVPPGILTNLEWATPSYMAALGMMRLHKKRAQTS